MDNPTLSPKSLQIVEKILSKNDKKANELREIYARDKLYVINLMSSPGSGKTTLLESLATYAKSMESVENGESGASGESEKSNKNGEAAESSAMSFCVIEGDLQTNRDADRLERCGIAAHQILTGAACHLEASMIESAYNALKQRNALNVEYLFIENVGNLVCPASYDLGAHLNLVLLSSAEGDDKVLKYPSMFLCADAVIISKADLCGVFDFSIDRVRADLAQLKPNIPIFQTSSKDLQSLRELVAFIAESKKMGYYSTHSF